MTAQDILNLKLPKELWVIIQHGLGPTAGYEGTKGGVPGPKTLEALDAYLKGQRPSEGASKLIDAICALAAKEVGVREKGTNLGARVEEYQTADDLGGGGYAWCASFICWLIREAIKGGASVPFSRPTTALAYGFGPWAENKPGVKHLKSGPVKRGDIIMFRDFSHVALAIGDERNGIIPTIEGNTNASGGREGDGVYKRNDRSRSSLRGFVRFQF